jgi:AP-1 complex subunit gamma-1
VSVSVQHTSPLPDIHEQAVSENKPVGSTGKEGDLLGDDVTPTSANTVVLPTTAKNTQDLLADIFGTSATSTASSPAATHKSTVDDILSLFSAPAPPQTSTPTTQATSAFSLPQAQSQPPAPPPPQPAQRNTPKFTPYTAYEKNELKITLTPQTSAAKPGVVMILARFQVLGQNSVTGLNFQAAVPKVRLSLLFSLSTAPIW